MYAGRVAGNGEVLAKSAFSLCDQGCDVIGRVLGWWGGDVEVDCKGHF